MNGACFAVGQCRGDTLFGVEDGLCWRALERLRGRVSEVTMILFKGRKPEVLMDKVPFLSPAQLTDHLCSYKGSMVL